MMQRSGEPASLHDGPPQVVGGQCHGRCGAQASQLRFGHGFGESCLVDPASDLDRIATGVQDGPVAGELALGVGDRLPRVVELLGDALVLIAGGL
jgi:hypothetical protein